MSCKILDVRKENGLLRADGPARMHVADVALFVGAQGIAVLGLYLDDSGHVDSTDVLVVGGFVASVEQWCGFAADWKNVLDVHRVNFFHATDCEAGQRQFKGWSKLRRDSFRQQLARAINRHGLVGIGRGVIVDDFKAVISRKNVFTDYDGKFGALHLILRNCLEHVARGWDARPLGKPIVVVFEAGTKYLNQALTYSNRLRKEASWASPYGFIGSAPKTDLVALEAADYYAYEIFKRARQVKQDPRLAESPAEMRPQLRWIVQPKSAPVPHTMRIWNKRNLGHLLEDMAAGRSRPSPRRR